MSKFVVPEDAVPAQVVSLCERLVEHGHRAWVVGGCIRDVLLGKSVADWDLATSAEPKEVMKVFRRVIPTGIQHGTVTVVMGGEGYEVTTLRGEGDYTDGRRPDAVFFVRDIEEDLARRDFTVNAIAYDPLGRSLFDPFDGQGDLTRRVIRAVGDPVARFQEDGLRVLRAARFVSTLEFALDPATEAAIAPTLDTYSKVSCERIREEWMKAMKARQPSRAFEVMARTGILARTAPALAALSAPAWRRCLLAMDALHGEGANLRLAALFSGVVQAAATPDAGAASVKAWLHAHRFSNEEKRVIAALATQCVACEARFADPQAVEAMPAPEMRRLILEIEPALLPKLVSVWASVAAHEPEWAAEKGAVVEAFRVRTGALLDEGFPQGTKELAVGGRDLMTALAIAPGPHLGKILDRLLSLCLDDPAKNEAQALVEAARAMLPELGVESGA